MVLFGHRVKASDMIAGLAFVLAVYTALSTYRHERLAALPHISYITEWGQGPFSGPYMENTGGGPLVFKQVETPPRGGALYTEVHFANTPPDPTTEDVGNFLRPGEKLWLFKIDTTQIDSSGFGKFKTNLRSLAYFFEYCSVYNQCWKSCVTENDTRCLPHRGPSDDIFSSWLGLFL